LVYTGLISAIKTIYQQETYRGFFKGNLLAISKHIPATLFQFYIIDDFKKLYLKSPQEVDLLKFYFASIYASTFSTIFTYPIDLVQTRYTAHNVNMPKLYPSIWRAFAKIRSEEKNCSTFSWCYCSNFS